MMLIDSSSDPGRGSREVVRAMLRAPTDVYDVAPTARRGLVRRVGVTRRGPVKIRTWWAFLHALRRVSRVVKFEVRGGAIQAAIPPLRGVPLHRDFIYHPGVALLCPLTAVALASGYGLFLTRDVTAEEFPILDLPMRYAVVGAADRRPMEMWRRLRDREEAEAWSIYRRYLARRGELMEACGFGGNLAIAARRIRREEGEISARAARLAVRSGRSRSKLRSVTAT